MNDSSQPIRICLVNPVDRLGQTVLPGVKYETQHMLKAKGLEYPVVVVSDQEGVNGEVSEGLYTALTRATHLAIVLLEAEGSNATWPVLAQLDRRRMIFYDDASRVAFDLLRSASDGGIE